MTKSFDHLLRDTLKAPLPEPPDGCLDAGVLAAWLEGTLDPIERAAAEAHAADCSRCQAVLAAMIRIEPPMESRPWWRSPAFGWLVPITVAAAALVVYVRMDRRPMESQVAQAPAVAAPAATTSPSSADQAAAERLSESAAAPRDLVASTAPPEPRASSRPSGQTAKLEAMAKRAEQTQMPVQSRAAPPAGEAPPRKDIAAAPLDELTRQRAASVAVTSPVTAPAASQPGAGLRDATPPPAAPAPSAAPSAEDRSKAAASLAESVVVNARTAPDTSRQPRVLVQTADGSTRWRILTPGSVQRSNDAGATWETQSTGVSVILSSGHAPSKTVCWLVGKGGVVLLSADGRSWLRVLFPEAVDLVSVTATDASSATVTTASGRTFTTVDGGRSWK